MQAYLPGGSEQVHVADVDHVVAVADIHLNFGSGLRGQSRNGEEDGVVGLHGCLQRVASRGGVC